MQTRPNGQFGPSSKKRHSGLELHGTGISNVQRMELEQGRKDTKREKMDTSGHASNGQGNRHSLKIKLATIEQQGKVRGHKQLGPIQGSGHQNV